jgi:enterochelin esterase-like enzyme
VHALAVLLSALVLPGFAPVAQEPAGGQLLAGTFPGTARPGYVYLPPRFDRSRRYPVVYLLHGLPGSPSEYVGGTELGKFADTEIAGGKIRPFIAVVPAAGDDERYDGEWAGPWETALVHRIVPWIDAHLPTIPAASGRIVAGLSAGGYGAVNTALRHLGLFGTAESWSGYFTPLRDGPFKDADKATLDANDPTLVALTEASTLRSRLRIFVSTGPLHSHWFKPQDTIDFANELSRLGVPVALRDFKGRTDQWRLQLDTGLVWALKP